MAASTVVSEVMGKVTFVHKLPMILKATSDNDTPTAGYLYQEISDLTYVSSSYCKSLLDVLVDRLDKSSHHIKFKVLRMMKFVVENGSEQFRSGLLRRSTGIQLATKFSGPPDQLHGNAPYIAVRTAAKELSEVLFDTEQSEPKEAGHKRTTAVGGLGASRSGGSMEGFGNTDSPLHKQKSLGDTIKEGFRQLTDSFREPSTPSSQSSFQSEYRPLRGSEVEASSSSSFLFSSGKQKPSAGAESFTGKGEYRPVSMDEGEAPMARMRNSPPRNLDVKRVTSAHQRGKPAGGWEDSIGGRGSNASNSDGQHSGDSTELSERLESVAVEDVSLETKLVEEFVVAADGKPKPSRDSLAQFVKRCATLNCEKVTELLGLELQSASTLIQMRCLCALEALMREDIASPDHLLGFLPNTLMELQGRTADRLLQAKASKILRQLERAKEEAEATRSPKHREVTRNAVIEPDCDVQPTGDPLILDVRESPAAASRGVPSWMSPAESSASDGPPGKVPTSLFSEMAVGSVPMQREQESQRAVVRLDEGGPGCEAPGDRRDGSAGVGSAQLLDDLLDLSWTDRPTLVPDVETHTPRNPRTLNQPHSAGGHQCSSPLQFHDQVQDSHQSVYGKESGGGLGNEVSVQGTRLPSSDATHALAHAAAHQPRQPDSIMSRNADVNDLIAATGIITLPTGISGQTDPTLSGDSTSRNPTQARPTQSRTPALSTDQISSLYPQLAGVRLSGTTAVPLNLAKKPADGNFAFAAENGGKENLQRAGSFDFVRDAMAASKK